MLPQFTHGKGAERTYLNMKVKVKEQNLHMVKEQNLHISIVRPNPWLRVSNLMEWSL